MIDWVWQVDSDDDETVPPHLNEWIIESDEGEDDDD